MDKETFLSELRKRLRVLNEAIIEETVNEYEFFIDEAIQSGVTEESVIKKLKHPEEIAREVKKAHGFAEQGSNPGRQMVIGFALILFNLCIVIGPVIGLYAALVSFYVTFFVLIFTPILMIFQATHPFEWFVSFILSGVGLILFPLTSRALKFIFQLTKQYIRWNVRIWKEGAYE